MKKILLSAFLFASLQSFAQQIDTIILPKPFYFTILGVGTEHSQISLIGNIAPEKFDGVQVAGIFNVGKGSVRGVQIAGLSNHSFDSLTGVQIGGFLNTVHGNVRGVQASGSINITDRDVYGAQLAGSFNIAAGDVHQLQVSGGMNYGKNIFGIQAAGGLNIASGTVYGLQLSGGLNMAQSVRGIQLGIVNLADSADGAMIGIFSYARHGYHKIEIGWNETMPLNFSFRTGSKIFHNIFAFGTDFRPNKLVWAFGYGAGTSWAVHKRLDIGADLVNYHVSKGEFAYSLSDLWKLNITADFHIAKNLSVAAGPSLNVFITDLHPGYGESTVTGIAPYYFFAQTYNNRYNAKAWVGASVAVRFF